MSDDADGEMAEADVANGEGRPKAGWKEDSKASATNDSEARYGEDESPA